MVGARTTEFFEVGGLRQRYNRAGVVLFSDFMMATLGNSSRNVLPTDSMMLCGSLILTQQAAASNPALDSLLPKG